MLTHLIFNDKNDITHAVPFDQAVLKAGANLAFSEEVDIGGLFRHISGPLSDRDFHNLRSNTQISSVEGILFGYGECVTIPPNIIDLPLHEVFKQAQAAQNEGSTTLDLKEASGRQAYDKWVSSDEDQQQTPPERKSIFDNFFSLHG